MNAPIENDELSKRISRDQVNAAVVVRSAQHEFARFRAPVVYGSGLHGPTEHDLGRRDFADKRLATLEAIKSDPFQAMVEVYTEVGHPAVGAQNRRWLCRRRDLRPLIDSNAVAKMADPALLLDAEITTRVNGEMRQHDRTSRMLFPIARQVAYISTFTTLVPGDIIVTGTPTGAGARFDPPIWLKPGDNVEITVPGIGTLINGVADEETGA